jgi:UDP-N-acetyl-2-amino-2-deoxyglucuronate dehydrogenase
MLKFALIGCGRISTNHINAALEMNLEIVSICDINISKCNELVKKHKLDSVRIYDSHNVMLTNEKIDLVAISTPNASHSTIALDFIRHGVNVIIEKPFTLSKNEYLSLLEARNKTGVKVTVCHQNRFNRAIQKVKETIDSGNLGRIHYISAKVFWYRDKHYYNQDAWRGSNEHMDGALMNQSIHNIDLLLWLMNSSVKNVIGLRRNFVHPAIEMEDFGAALIEFENDSIGFFEATTAAFPKNLEESLYIVGDKGTIKVGGQSVNLIEEWRVESETELIEDIQQKYSEYPESIYGFGHKLLYKDIIESIELNREPLVSLEGAYKAIDLILEIYGM